MLGLNQDITCFHLCIKIVIFYPIDAGHKSKWSKFCQDYIVDMRNSLTMVFALHLIKEIAMSPL